MKIEEEEGMHEVLRRNQTILIEVLRRVKKATIILLENWLCVGVSSWIVVCSGDCDNKRVGLMVVVVIVCM